MDVKEAINMRRAYRSLEFTEISEEILNELATAASLMPSCFNNQPWRFVFVHDPTILARVKSEGLTEKNAWAKAASMIIAVFTKKDLDCIIKEREYAFFDTGIATAAVILRATELGLVAHPIAGFFPEKIHDILLIPPEYTIITLVIIGKKSNTMPSWLTVTQISSETERPERKPLNSFVYRNLFSPL